LEEHAASIVIVTEMKWLGRSQG